MKVLITGATSHLGRALVKQFPEGCLCLCVRDPMKALDLPKGSTYAICQLEEPDTFVRAIKKFRPHVVYHLAWYGSVRDRDSLYQINMNVPATLKIAQACVEVGCALVFAGSLSENGTLNNPYLEAKRSSSRLMAMYCRRGNIPYAVAKLGTLYGPHDDDRHLIPQLIKSSTSSWLPMTDGYESYDFTYVDDAAEALMRLAGHDGIYEVGTGETHDLRYLVSLMKEVSFFQPRVEWGVLPSTEVEFIADISKLNEDTGWVPRHSLMKGIMKTSDWYYIERKRRLSE